MNQLSFGFILSTGISWFDRDNDISLLCQKKILSRSYGTEYYVNDILHRENGPAGIYFRGKTYRGKHYYNKGKRHRINGPAVIKYKGDKRGGYYKSHELYYVNDIQVGPEKFTDLRFSERD